MVAARRILAIDDEPLMLRALVRSLGAHQITCATSGAEALAIAPQLDPELVICDYELKDTNGREVIAGLRERGVRAPVLLVSGTLGHDDWVEWAAYLADDFLPKPFRSEMLQHKVQRLLEAEAMSRDVARKHAELARLHAREELEAAAANELLSRMVNRGTFPPGVRISSVPAGNFSGDVVLGTHVGDRYRWLVGDVTGHTLASAMVTLPLAMVFYGSSANGVSLDELVATMDGHLGMILPVNMFCAAACMELDRTLGTLRVWGGGAPEVAVLRADRSFVKIDSVDPSLAVLRGRVAPQRATIVDVSPGDRVFAFSDGLYEATDAQGEMLGQPAIWRALVDGPPEQAFDRMFEVWRWHRGGSPAADDMCLVEVVV